MGVTAYATVRNVRIRFFLRAPSAPPFRPFYYSFAANGAPPLINVLQTTPLLPRRLLVCRGALICFIGAPYACKAPRRPQALPKVSQTPWFRMHCAHLHPFHKNLSLGLPILRPPSSVFALVFWAGLSPVKGALRTPTGIPLLGGRSVAAAPGRPRGVHPHVG